MKTIITLAVALSFCAVCRTTQAQVDLDHARKVIIARLDALQDLHAEYQQVEKFTPAGGGQPTASPGGGITTRLVGDRTSKGELWFFHGHLELASVLAGETLNTPERNLTQFGRTVRFYTPERYEQLMSNADSTVPQGDIRPPQSQSDSVLDVALGLRCDYNLLWFSADDIAKMDLSVMPDGTVLLSQKTDWDVRNWIFNPGNEFALVKYQRFVRDGKPALEIVNENLKKSDGMQLPYEITEKYFTAGNKDQVGKTVSLSVRVYKLNAAGNPAAANAMTWPPGARIRDMRSNLNLPVPATARAFEDADIAALAKQREADQAKLMERAKEMVGPTNDQGVSTQPMP